LIDADYSAYSFQSFVSVKGQHLLSGLLLQSSLQGNIMIILREIFFGCRREV
jgi:hypothetical protein